jgi:hypothetical protein
MAVGAGIDARPNFTVAAAGDPRGRPEVTRRPPVLGNANTPARADPIGFSEYVVKCATQTRVAAYIGFGGPDYNLSTAVVCARSRTARGPASTPRDAATGVS